jgi:PAS domain S-box-containing protein
MPRPSDPPPSRAPDASPPPGADPDARLTLLAEAGRSLASSLDYATTLANVARLAVPTLADWCAVDVVEDDQSLQRVAVVHPDPARVELAQELFRRHPPDPDASYGVWNVLRTGRSEIYPDISDDMLRSGTRDPEVLSILRRLGLRSAMLVPLLARGRSLGVLTLVAAESGRRYGPEDLTLAEELAVRCGLAVDNARLYRAAQGAEQRYRDLVDGLDAIVWEADPSTGRYTFVSRRAEELLGYPVARWLEDPEFWVTLLHPDDREAAVAACRSVRARTSGHNCEYRAVAADGHEVWLRDVGYVVRAAGEASRRSRGMIIDVTERHYLDEALRASERNLRLIAENTQDVLFAYDMARRLVYVNPAFEALTGYTVAELWRDGAIEYTHPQDRRRRQELLESAYRGQSCDGVEYRIITRGGALKWCVASWGPLLDGEGRQIGIQGREHDVTQRKHMEEELRHRAEDLDAASRHKDEFLATLAHELRNPLAPIRNALQILRLRGGDPTTRGWAGDVLERQVGHLTRLVDDLLDVSRITRRKIVLQRQRVDLARLVRVAAEDHRAALEGAGLGLELDLPPTALWVEGDATRLAQVLDNLLSNAGKFTPPGGRVTVRLQGSLAGAPGSCGGGRARIVVRDTGVGIAPDLLPRLFQTLTQADASLERSQGGLGLGLALVKGLVELHGGQVEAHSAGLGQGAEFVVTLPLEQGVPVTAGPASGAGGKGQPLRILMVEDNRDGAETLQTLLQLAGHEVALACTGPEGVALAREFHPDVVLCDIGLPGMDGFAVGRALRQDPVTAGSRLIVLSGYGQEEDRRKSREAGFDLHLTKPVDPFELQRLLRAQPVGAGRGTPVKNKG